jgi:hypothetical protein
LAKTFDFFLRFEPNFPLFFGFQNNVSGERQNRFDAFDKRKNSRGFEHENNFQEVNQQNSSTRFFIYLTELFRL